MNASPIELSDIKDRLVGLDSWFRAAAASDAQYDDAKITSLIRAWIRRFERETTFRVNPVRIVSAPDGTYDVPTPGQGTISSSGKTVTGTGTAFESFFAPGQILQVGAVGMVVDAISSDTSLTLFDKPPAWSNKPFAKLEMPVIVEAGYPYYQECAGEFFRVTFRERPIRSVNRLRLIYNGGNLRSNTVYQIPPDWFSIDAKSGKFWMLPYYGQAAYTTASAALAVYSVLLTDCLPNFLFFDYVAGLPDEWQYMAEWADVRLALSEYCALQVLNDISESVGAGIANKSLSVDGISQTLPYERFVRRKQELQASIQAFQLTLAAQETPLMLEAV